MGCGQSVAVAPRGLAFRAVYGLGDTLGFTLDLPPENPFQPAPSERESELQPGSHAPSKETAESGAVVNDHAQKEFAAGALTAVARVRETVTEEDPNRFAHHPNYTKQLSPVYRPSLLCLAKG